MKDYMGELIAAISANDQGRILALAMEMAQATVEPPRSAGAERQRRYKERKKTSPTVTQSVTPAVTEASPSVTPEPRARDVVRNNDNDNVTTNYNYELLAGAPETVTPAPEKPVVDLVGQEKSSPVKDGHSPGSWVVQAHQKWVKCIGDVSVPRLGKELKPAYERYGLPKLLEMIWLYSAVKKAKKQATNIKWFANETTMWAEHERPDVDEWGCMNPTLELITRP